VLEGKVLSGWDTALTAALDVTEALGLQREVQRQCELASSSTTTVAGARGARANVGTSTARLSELGWSDDLSRRGAADSVWEWERDMMVRPGEWEMIGWVAAAHTGLILVTFLVCLGMVACGMMCLCSCR